MSKRTIIILFPIVSISYIFGVFSFRHDLFPIPQLRSFRNKFLGHNPISKTLHNCPVVDKQKLGELDSISEVMELKNIFWGDSVVEGMHDSRFYNINKYQEVAQSGQIIYCALREINYILNFKPESVLIYIGGNDADGQSWYGPKQAALYYEQVIETLLANKIRPIIHLIHKGSLSRNQDYVTEYNQRLMGLAKRNDIPVIPGMTELSFTKIRSEIKKSNNLYSYDGEHLKPEGYKLWIKHIKKYINDF